MIERYLDEAYKLYMPQVRSEISALCNLIRSHREQCTGPYNILEIGTKFGGTFYLWNSINPGPGCNVSIDMNDGGQHGGISEEDMDKRDLWFQERFSNCHFIRKDSHWDSTKHSLYLLLMKLLGKENDNGKWYECIDFLFLDGDHTKEGVKMDYEMYSPFVKTGGIIAFHDIVISDHHHSRNVYVGEFWNEIKEKYDYTEFIEPGNDWAGIGCLTYH